MALAASFGLGTFHRVRLQKRVKLRGLAPVALEIVEFELAGVGVADNRIQGKSHGAQSGNRGCHEVQDVDQVVAHQRFRHEGVHSCRETPLAVRRG